MKGTLAWMGLATVWWLGGCGSAPEGTGPEIPETSAQILEISGMNAPPADSFPAARQSPPVSPPPPPPLVPSRPVAKPAAPRLAPVAPRPAPGFSAHAVPAPATGEGTLPSLGGLGKEEARVQQAWEEGKGQEMARELSGRLQRDPSPEVRYLHGKLALLQGKEKEAAADFSALANEHPPHELGLRGLALLAEKKRDFEEVRLRYEQLVKRFPSRGEYVSLLAQACEQLGRDEEALRYYREEVKLVPGAARASQGVGRLALKLQRLEEGIELLENLPDRTLRALLWLARLHQAMFERDRNLTSLNAALKYYEQFLAQAGSGEEAVPEARSQIPRLRQAAADNATRMQDLPLEEKLVRLKNGSPEMKKAIIASFFPIPPPAAVPILLEALGDPSPEIRERAVKLLGVARPENLVSNLAYLFLLEENLTVKKAVLETFGKIEQLSAVPTLLAALREDERKLSETAHTSLCLVADKNGGRPREKVPTDSAELASYWSHWWESVRKDAGEGGEGGEGGTASP